MTTLIALMYRHSELKCINKHLFNQPSKKGRLNIINTWYKKKGCSDEEQPFFVDRKNFGLEVAIR
jgi:hypothetical protein